MTSVITWKTCNFAQVDGLEKAVKGDRKLRLHTARMTNGIMNAVGSMHRPSPSRTGARTYYTHTVSTISFLCPRWVRTAKYGDE